MTVYKTMEEAITELIEPALGEHASLVDTEALFAAGFKRVDSGWEVDADRFAAAASYAAIVGQR